MNTPPTPSRGTRLTKRKLFEIKAARRALLLQEERAISIEEIVRQYELDRARLLMAGAARVKATAILNQPHRK